METPQPKRPVKIEVSGKFYEQLQDEKLRRNLTIQQIIRRALRIYLAIPESQHRELEEEWQLQARAYEEAWRNVIRAEIEKNRKSRGVDARIPIPASALKPGQTLQKLLERADLADQMREYVRQFPIEKARQMVESAKLDLKYYRSARIKGKKMKGPVTTEQPAGKE